MPEPILVPLDGSPSAEQALPIARALAAHLGAPLLLASVYQPFLTREMVVGAPVYDRRYDDEQLATLRQQLHEVAGRIAAAAPAGVTELVVEDTDVAGALLRAARERGAQLVVTTTHGRGGWRRAWLGSVADRLVRESPIPLLLVRVSDDAAGAGESRVGAPERGFRRLVLPLDGSALAEAAIEPALRLAADDATVRLLRVVKVPPTRSDPESTFWTPLERDAIEEQRAEATRYLAEVAGRAPLAARRIESHVVLHASPAEAILAEAESHGAELVALSTHGRGGLARVVAGSVADKVYRAAAVPTLVVRPAGGA